MFLLLASPCFAMLKHGSHVKCSEKQEGKRVSAYMPLLESKINCQCKSGILIGCQLENDARCNRALQGCPIAKRDQGYCPHICQQCHVNQTVFKSGQMKLNSEDVCQVSECFSGVLTTTTMQCPPALCPSPTLAPGNCCPSCPSCQRAGQWFREGETKADILDPCNECSCSKGRLTCVRKACPVLPCEDKFVVSVKGKCCPQCSKHIKPKIRTVEEKKVCLFRNQQYQIGNQFKPDNCTTCTCQHDSTIVCQRMTCPVLNCPIQKQVMKSGCCKQCEDENVSEMLALPAIQPKHCKYGQKIIEDGKEWQSKCQTCQCQNGTVQCRAKTCPKLNCERGSKPILKPGNCRPTCAAQGICTVFGDPLRQAAT